VGVGGGGGEGWSILPVVEQALAASCT